MAKWADEAAAAWIMGASYSELAIRYGRSPSTVFKMIKRRGVVRTVENPPSGRKPQAKMPCLGRIHRSIGIRLGMFRTIEQSNVTEIGDRLGTSRLKVSNMERGLHDFTITELMQIAGLLNASVAELCEEP
jgi:hypothetical protein